MNERFLIPTAVAAALHAVLFFGFNSGDIPVLPHKSPATTAVPRELVKVEWVPATNDSTDAPDTKPAAAVVAPDIPEPPPRDFDAFQDIPIPREAPRVSPVTTTNMIPTGLVDPSEGGSGDGPGRSGPISFDMLDNLPRTRSQLSPVYPDEARRNGRPGEVLVEFVVDETGHVLDPHVLHSNDRVFNEPTLRAVAKWRFEPGRKNGRVVRFRMAVPVAYAVNP